MALIQNIFSLFKGKPQANTQGDWRNAYEYHADLEIQKLNSKPVPALLADIEAGRFDPYHQIWYVTAKRSEPKLALPVLFRALNNCQDYLQQYHCAAAILHLLKKEPLVNGRYPDDSTAVDYTTSRANYPEARRRLQQLIDDLQD